MKMKIQNKNGKYIMVYIYRRKAIRLKCLDCSAWSVKEVNNCIFHGCLLYRFRLSKGKQSASERTKAIKGYCDWCMGNQHGEVIKCPSQDCPLFPFRMARIDRSVEIKTVLDSLSPRETVNF